MISGSLSRRYARALLDLGLADGAYERYGDELDELARTFAGSKELTESLTNPVLPQRQRRAVLEELLARAAVSRPTRNLVLLLLDRERIAVLPGIARELRTLVDERAGRVRARVTSAQPLATEHVGRIVGLLERATGKKVVLERREDAALLGGVVTQVGDVVYDGSVRTQLELLKERFLA